MGTPPLTVELPRALRRSQPGVLSAVAGVLARLHRVEINATVRAIAGAYSDPALRPLDAIHLATTELLVNSGKSVQAFVTYDKRLAAVVARRGCRRPPPAEEPSASPVGVEQVLRAEHWDAVD